MHRTYFSFYAISLTLGSLLGCSSGPQSALSPTKAPAAASPSPTPSVSPSPTPSMGPETVRALCQAAARAKLGGASLAEYGWPVENSKVWSENGSYVQYPADKGAYYCTLPEGGTPMITIAPD